MNGTNSASNIAGILLSVSNVLVPPCSKRTSAQTIYKQPRRQMARPITQDRVGLTSDANGERTGGSPTEDREVLRLLAGRLIGAQEEERKRISRELHDSLGSDIFVLSTKISLIRDGLSHGIERVNLELQELQQAVAALGHKIRSISHNLHPGTCFASLKGPCATSCDILDVVLPTCAKVACKEDRADNPRPWHRV